MYSKATHLQCDLQTTRFKTNIITINEKYFQKLKDTNKVFVTILLNDNEKSIKYSKNLI